MENKQITITEATARRAMARLIDWLEWVEDLDTETRADVIALDELIRVLDAEAERLAWADKRKREHAAHMAEHQERIKAEAVN